MQSAAVVTGAANGIGRAIAEELVARGHLVVAVDIDEAGLDTLASTAGGAVVPVAGDIRQQQTHQRAADAAVQHGRLDHWINNAGAEVLGGAHEVTEEDLRAGLDLLLLGPMLGLTTAVRRMLPLRSGSIVNITSTQGSAAFPRFLVYGSAKAALLQATRSVALDYAAYGIRCNAVSPGAVDTPLARAAIPAGVDVDEALRREGLLAPMGRVGSVAEVARAVAWIGSVDASYLTGHDLVVDGGQSVRNYPYPVIPLDAPARYTLPPDLAP